MGDDWRESSMVHFMSLRVEPPAGRLGAEHVAELVRLLLPLGEVRERLVEFHLKVETDQELFLVTNQVVVELVLRGMTCSGQDTPFSDVWARALSLQLCGRNPVVYGPLALLMPRSGGWPEYEWAKRHVSPVDFLRALQDIDELRTPLLQQTRKPVNTIHFRLPAVCSGQELSFLP